MKIVSVLVAVVLSSVVSPVALANTHLARPCMGCHQTHKKVLGPSFQQVAQRYATQPDAVAHIATSILKGSKGKWGPIPMAPNRISEADAQALATWILSLQ